MASVTSSRCGPIVVLPRARSAAKLPAKASLQRLPLRQLRAALVAQRGVARFVEAGELVGEGPARARDPRHPPLHEQRPLGSQDRLTRPGHVALLLPQRRVSPGQGTAISQQRPEVGRLGQRQHPVEVTASLERRPARECDVAREEHHGEPPADGRGEPPFLHVVDGDPLPAPCRDERCRQRSCRLAIERRLDVKSRSAERDSSESAAPRNDRSRTG